MTLLSKLTLIIPTFNRPSYALRNMQYWSGREVTVHVLDGSVEAIENCQLRGLAPNVNYHYLPIPILDRLGRAEDYLQTEYVALLGDDEFHIPSGLMASIAELEADDRLVSCMGRCLVFKPNACGVDGALGYTAMKGYSIIQDDPIERMIAHMNPYTSSAIYSVVRTPVWKHAMSILPRRAFSVFAIGELQFELAVCFLGKSKVLPRLSWLRSKEQVPIRENEPCLITNNKFQKWWKDTKKRNEREEFLSIMSDSLSIHTAIEKISIREGLRKAGDAFCLHESRSQRVEFRTAAIRRVPRPLKEIVKCAISPLRSRSQISQKSLLEAARDLERSGVLIDYDELAKIETLILQFHSADQINN